MPIWLSIVLSIVGGTGIGSLITMSIVNHFRRQRQKIKDYDKEQESKHLRSVMREELAPVFKSMEEIKNKLDLDSEGTITLLRDRMKCSLNYCRRQGYKSGTDMANWSELYNSYKALGGNHFREYVNQWKAEMEALPLQEEHHKGE